MKIILIVCLLILFQINTSHLFLSKVEASLETPIKSYVNSLFKDQNIPLFLINLPKNFRQIIQNLITNKKEIQGKIQNLKESYSDSIQVESNLTSIFQILSKNITYSDSEDFNLLAFEEFELFNNCHRSLVSGYRNDYSVFTTIYNFIVKQNVNWADLFENLALLSEITHDELKFCSELYNHILN